MQKIGIDHLVRKFFKNTFYHRLNGVKNILLFYKAHLKVKLVKLTWASISPTILVTETGGDLEIAIKTADHDQLFELLRGLRQGIKFARMKAGRHQKIARTFGR